MDPLTILFSLACFGFFFLPNNNPPELTGKPVELKQFSVHNSAGLPEVLVILPEFDKKNDLVVRPNSQEYLSVGNNFDVSVVLDFPYTWQTRGYLCMTRRGIEDVLGYYGYEQEGVRCHLEVKLVRLNTTPSGKVKKKTIQKWFIWPEGSHGSESRYLSYVNEKLHGKPIPFDAAGSTGYFEVSIANFPRAGLSGYYMHVYEKFRIPVEFVQN